MSFEDMVQLPIYQRRVINRKKVFTSYWMTSDENFKKIQKIEAENAKKEIQKEKENIKKKAVAKVRKVKAAIKRKQKKNVIKKIKSNPKL